jgi:uncharacterized protein (DUF927 family)
VLYLPLAVVRSNEAVKMGTSKSCGVSLQLLKEEPLYVVKCSIVSTQQVCMLRCMLSLRHYQDRETTHMLIAHMEHSQQKTMKKLTKLLNYSYEINQNLFLTCVAGCELCKQRFHSANENGKLP